MFSVEEAWVDERHLEGFAVLKADEGKLFVGHLGRVLFEGPVDEGFGTGRLVSRDPRDCYARPEVTYRIQGQFEIGLGRSRPADIGSSTGQLERFAEDIDALKNGDPEALAKYVRPVRLDANDACPETRGMSGLQAVGAGQLAVFTFDSFRERARSGERRNQDIPTFKWVSLASHVEIPVPEAS